MAHPRHILDAKARAQDGRARTIAGLDVRAREPAARSFSAGGDRHKDCAKLARDVRFDASPRQCVAILNFKENDRDYGHRMPPAGRRQEARFGFEGHQGQTAGGLVVRRLRRHRHDLADRRRTLGGGHGLAGGPNSSTSQPATATPRWPPPGVGARSHPPTMSSRCSGSAASAPNRKDFRSNSGWLTPKICRSPIHPSTPLSPPSA